MSNDTCLVASGSEDVFTKRRQACRLARPLRLSAQMPSSEAQDALTPQEHQQYRKLVGQLWWMGNLRMDIMHAIKELSRRLASPTTDHWAKLKHLLRYLRGTKDYVQELCPKLRLSEKHSSLGVHTYMDNDWAGDPDSRRSTSGVAAYLSGVNLQSHASAQVRHRTFERRGRALRDWRWCGGFAFHPVIVA